MQPDPDINRFQRQQATEDGYDMRTRWPHMSRIPNDDVSPCEQETPEVIEVEYVREPLAGQHVFGSAVLLICILLAFVLAIYVLAF